VRRALPLLAAAGLAVLGGCGTCLVVSTRDSTLTTRDGETVPIRISLRHHGLFEHVLEPADRDQAVPAILAAPLTECIDVVAVVLGSVRCLFDGDTYVEGGPFGCIAALTPFANVSPGPQGPPPAPRDVDPADVALLRGPAGPARDAALRRVFPDLDVRAVTVR
jgi:hypothetical protein